MALFLGASRLLPVRGGRPFCSRVISQILIVFGGSFSEKEALPEGSFYQKWYKEIIIFLLYKQRNRCKVLY